MVVNAVGVIKQLDAAKEPIPSILTNSLLPHRIAALCARTGTRLIHLSTDCVFAGRRGPYSESDPPDAEDLYGRSKLLGEVSQAGCLTLRSSIVGTRAARPIEPDRMVLVPTGRSSEGLCPGSLYRHNDKCYG